MENEDYLSTISEVCKNQEILDKYNDELLKPMTYQVKKQHKMVKVYLHALNYWLQLSDEKFNFCFDITSRFSATFKILDDYVDGSEISSKTKTTHLVYGMPLALTSMHYGIFRLLEDIAKINDPKLTKLTIETGSFLCKGQALEIYWREKFICPSFTEYSVMAKLKSSKCFVFVVGLMQFFVGDERDFSELMNLLGIFYVLHNDYYNLFGPEDEKHLTKFADDITEGKFSFPLVHAIHTLKNKEVEEILRQRPKDFETRKKCVDILKEIGTQEYCLKILGETVEKIKAKIAEHGGNPIFEMFMDSFNFDSYWN